ncbi:hypothetical protein NDU88_002065 [Pleurodeles waltl]|uniref:Uncharacterized protein n=1 Tax=Pleurodeles waltl TaxID=8319 RepID=A0AAV7UXV4_PLEWA|nr:hypothetical protein NDU88_002065 [Pleurodeles waltl]
MTRENFFSCGPEEIQQYCAHRKEKGENTCHVRNVLRNLPHQECSLRYSFRTHIGKSAATGEMPKVEEDLVTPHHSEQFPLSQGKLKQLSRRTAAHQKLLIKIQPEIPPNTGQQQATDFFR